MRMQWTFIKKIQNTNYYKFSVYKGLCPIVNLQCLTGYIYL